MDFIDIELPWKPIKVLLRGPTGAGKTMNGLRIATMLAEGKPVAFLDSESGRGQLMARAFKFKYASLSGNYSPARYVEAIDSAISAGFGAIVLDSLTQAWSGVNGTLDQVNSRGGNTFTDGWGKVGAPLQSTFMDAIISCPVPMVCTVRSKMGYDVNKDDRGKSVPTAIGMEPEQRRDLSYEFDVVLDVTMDHEAHVVKMPPIEGLATNIAADGYVAWFTKVTEWLRTGVMTPQTWAEIKSRLHGDSNRMELARQCKNSGKNVAETWIIVQAEPAHIDAVVAAPIVVESDTIEDEPEIVEELAVMPGTPVETVVKPPVQTIVTPTVEPITWGKVMTFAAENDKGQANGQKGVLTSKAKALRVNDKTANEAMAVLEGLVKDRVIVPV